MIRKLIPLLLLTATLKPNQATEKLATTVMAAWPAGAVATTKKPGDWGYEEGVLLDGLAAEWQVAGNPMEMSYIRQAVDKYILPDGTIQMNATGRPYPTNTHTLDDIELGRAVLFIHTQTKDERYAKAANFLHDQLAAQPRNPSGGYWHKQIYPNQMWLDGAYMAEPFRAQFAVLFHHPEDFDDIAKQLLLMDTHMRAPAGGLLRHGWDESKQMPWAGPKSGLSPEVWARAVGWYAMALVDTLEFFPTLHPQYAALRTALNRTLRQIVATQDPVDHIWWQVLDKQHQPGNFEEASASSMFVYALAKAAHHDYAPAGYIKNAQLGWAGIQTHFIKTASDGTPTLTGTVKAAGLGGTPYRSGSYDYYVHEPVGDNDAKGVGAYLLAGAELAKSFPIVK